MSLKQRLTQQIEQMWWQRTTPSPWLTGASRLYGRISRQQQAARLARAEQPPLPLISVGNITAGGSGKTPFVIWLTHELQQAGRNPVVLCRGDGGRQQAPKLLDESDRPQAVGDEAVLLQRLCNCPVIAGRDRITGSRMAAEHGDVIILDDGFQYRQLRRTCDIVLVPAEGVGNGALIPAGPLREPVEALSRADIIVRTGHATGNTTPISSNREWHWLAAGSQLRDWQGLGMSLPHTVTPLTGIARPGRFLDNLQQLGLTLHAPLLYPDHHPFSSNDVAAAFAHGLPVVTTAKDAVKLQQLWPAQTPLWVLEQKTEPEAGLFAAIAAFVG